MNIWKFMRQFDFSSHQVVGTSLGGLSLGGALFNNMPAALLTGLFGFTLVQHLHFKRLRADKARQQSKNSVEKTQKAPTIS